MRVYEPTRQELVQQHHGHSDAVRCILHVPEKQQYITASWDHTIRVWRAYAGPEKGGGGGGRAAARGGAAAEGAAPKGGELAEEASGAADVGTPAEEEHTPTYAELHPLREPKWLSDRNKGGGGDKFLKKSSNEDTREKRKKKQAEDELAAKSVNGLALELAKLEERLLNEIEHKPPSKEDRRGGRGNERMRGMRGGQPRPGGRR